MASKVSEIWERALNRFEEETRRATENLKKGVERARSGADVDNIVREAYERVERTLTFPKESEVDRLRDRLQVLADRLETLEKDYGVDGKKRKKKKSKKKNKAKSKKKKSKSKPKNSAKKKSKSKKKKKK